MKLSALFDPRYTLTVHVVQVILILLVFILAIARVSMTEVPITRANIMPIPIVRTTQTRGPPSSKIDLTMSAV